MSFAAGSKLENGELQWPTETQEGERDTAAKRRMGRSAMHQLLYFLNYGKPLHAMKHPEDSLLAHMPSTLLLQRAGFIVRSHVKTTTLISIFGGPILGWVLRCCNQNNSINFQWESLIPMRLLCGLLFMIKASFSTRALETAALSQATVTSVELLCPAWSLEPSFWIGLATGQSLCWQM